VRPDTLTKMIGEDHSGAVNSSFKKSGVRGSCTGHPYPGRLHLAPIAAQRHFHFPRSAILPAVSVKLRLNSQLLAIQA
jgi:hypothetical protein